MNHSSSTSNMTESRDQSRSNSAKVQESPAFIRTETGTFDQDFSKIDKNKKRKQSYIIEC